MPVDIVKALSLPVVGHQLTGATLGDQVAGRTLLVFLRHLGCPLTREMVRDVRQAIENVAEYPAVVFVCMGSCEESKPFFDRFYPEARVVCDPSKELYQAFGIPRATAMQMYGPMAWTCYLRTTVGGFAPGKTIGDMWQKPGILLIEPPGTVAWEHRFDGIGDRVDFQKLPR